MKVEHDQKGPFLTRNVNNIAQKYLRVWLFKGALVLAVAITVALVLYSLRVYRHFRTAEVKHAKIHELKGEIIHLDEVLTMSARMAAATGDPKWEKRYRDFGPQLDAVIKEAINFVPEALIRKAVQQIDIANIKLVAMENEAFDLIRLGKLEEAAARLSNDEYEQQKRQYTEGMEHFNTAIHNHMNSMISKYREGFLSLAAVLIIVVSLTISGWLAIFQMHRRLTERRQAEDALRESEEQFRAIYDHASDGILLVNAETKQFFNANKTMIEMLGYSEEEIKGLRVADIHPAKDLPYVASQFEKQARGEIEVASDIPVKRKDDSLFYADVNSASVVLNGETYLLGIFRDITDRKQAKETLRNERDKAQTYLDVAGVMFVVVNTDGNVSMINRKGCEVLGYEEDMIIGKCWFNHFLPEEQREQVREVFGQLMKGEIEPVEYYENTVVNKHGEERLISWHNSLLKDSSGNITGCLSSGKDITDRKRVEEALLQSEKKYRSLTNNIPGMVYRGNADWSVNIYSNSESVCGYSNEDFRTHKIKWVDIIYPDDKQRVREEGIELAIKPSSIVQAYRITARDGSIRWVEDHKIALFTDDGIFNGVDGVVFDITERKRVEEEIAKLSKFPDENPNPVMRIHRDGTILYANNASVPVLAVWGWQTGERVPEPGLAHIEKAFRSGKPYIFEDNCDEHIFLVTLASVVKSNYLNAYALDITERKQAEEQRKRTLEFMQTVIDGFSEGLMVINRDYTVALANRTVREMAGAKDPVGEGLKCHHISHESATPCEGAEHPCPLEQVVTTKAPVTFEHVHYDAERRASSVEVIAAPIFDEKGEVVQIIESCRDITERKRANEEQARLREELFQSQKLESVGMLAGGIAHDFNNLMQGIMGYVQLIKLRMDESEEHYAELNFIEVLGEKAADLTQQLLSFARKGKYVVGSVEIDKVVEEVVALLNRTIDKTIIITAKVPSSISRIKADANQIHQVLLNLCINAKDAMPDGGSLTISAEEVDIDEGNIPALSEARPGRYVCLKVKDTGSGMDEETRARIFEPFFTTKEVGKGTGLGLSMAHGVIENHDGFIEVQSALGKGTRFQLYLPAIEAEKAEEMGPERPQPPEAIVMDSAKKDKRILVVDDEEIIRYLAVDMLTGLGYETVSAADGLEAVNIFEKEKDAIDLVLLDMIMPKLGGVETFRRLRDIDPAVPIVLISGYTKDEAAQELLDEGASSFIQKPYKLEELVGTIQTI
jgi:PAS domain S-box-containing protein